MAQAPTSQRLGLTRDQLAAFLSDHEQIKQFENLFNTVDTEVSGGLVTESTILAGTAYAMGNEALAGVAALNALVAPLVTAPPPTGGTVTSVAASGGTTGMTFSGSPITTSGTLTLGGTLGFANGGTGLTATPANGQLLIGNSAGYTLSTLTAGTAISISNASGSITITNTAPDQTVSLTAGTGISITGTYPSFTITNTLPDQVVSLTGAGTTVVTGTYPSFTITSNDQFTGTVTSVGLSGGTTGLTVSGTNPITTSGTFTLGGTLAIANGGTNGSATPTAGGIAYGTGTAYAFSSAGTAGQFLTSTGGGTPTWSTASSPFGNPAYWGSFWDTTDQAAAAANTAYAVTLNSADPSNNGTTVVSGSRVTFAHAGIYSLIFSIQFMNTDNQIHDANVWMRKNGTNIPDSDTKLSIQNRHGGVNGYGLMTVNFVFSLAAGDYIEMVWAATNTSISIQSEPAGTTPVSPSVPGVIFTAVSAPHIGIGYAGVASTTSMTIGTGSKTFTTNVSSTDTAFTVGNRVRLIYDATNYMEGTITAFSGTSMTVNVDTTAGSGTYATWSVGLTGVVNTGVTSFSGGSTGLTPSTATSGAVTLAGTLNVIHGGTGTSTQFTTGSVVFAGASGVYGQDNSNFFWNDTNNRLGLGTASPAATLDSRGVVSIGGAADASLHISQVYGGNGRLSQMSVNSNSTDALNIIASKNGGGTDQWFSYGVTSGNNFFVQSGVGSGSSGLVITSGNSVLVNESSPSAASLVHNFEVNGDIMSTGPVAGLFWANRQAAPSSGANWYGWYTASGTIYLYNPAAGNIASINASTGAYTALSDVAKKKDFEPSSIGLDAVMALKPTLFRMETDAEDAPKQLGFIAQEVKDHIPQAYVEEQNVDAVGKETVYIGLNDRPIVAALVKAVQELTARVAELEGKQ